jgi:hypothetical protein
VLESEGEHGKLTAGQRDVWFSQRLNPDEPVNIGAYLEIVGGLDLGIFETALRQTMSEVDAVHMRFPGDDDAPGQYVIKRADWPLDVIDVSFEADPHAAAEDWMRTDMCRPVDLREGPLFAHAVFRTGPDQFLWYQRGHRIAIDEFSIQIIAARQAQVYTSILEGGLPPSASLEPVSVLMRADSSYRMSPGFARDREFWRNTLTDFPGAAGVSGREAALRESTPARHMVNIGPGGTAELRAACRRLGTNSAVLMITAAAVYLHRSTGLEDVAVGIPVPRRIGKRLREIPGMTADVLPVRVRIGGDSTPQGLVREVSRSVTSVLRHQRYRYSDIRADLSLRDGSPLLGLVMNVVTPVSVMRFGDCTAVVHDLPAPSAADLCVQVYDRLGDGGIEIAFDVNPGRSTETSGRDIAGQFRDVLQWLMKPAVSGGAVRSAAAPARTLAELVAVQVRRAPDAVAVVCGDVCVSYAGLDVAANRLARLLVAAGAGPEVRVGILTGRRAEMVVWMLAVLKTGGAYLALDPAWPAQRVAFTLGDAGVGVLVAWWCPGWLCGGVPG